MCPHVVKKTKPKNFVPSCALMWSKTKTLNLCVLMWSKKTKPKNFVPSCALMWSKTKTLNLCARMWSK